MGIGRPRVSTLVPKLQLGNVSRGARRHRTATCRSSTSCAGGMVRSGRSCVARVPKLELGNQMCGIFLGSSGLFLTICRARNQQTSEDSATGTAVHLRAERRARRTERQQGQYESDITVAGLYVGEPSPRRPCEVSRQIRATRDERRYTGRVQQPVSRPGAQRCRLSRETSGNAISGRHGPPSEKTDATDQGVARKAAKSEA